jgi:hypothetical protein
MGGIFYHDRARCIRGRLDRRHVTWQSGKVNRHDNTRISMACKDGRKRSGAHIDRMRINVDKNGPSAYVESRIGACNERDRRCHQRFAWTEIGRQRSKV